MTKCYCDICGKECTNEEFTIPVMYPYYARGDIGNAIVGMTYKVRSNKMNLCEDCQHILGGYMYDLMERIKETNKEN